MICKLIILLSIIFNIVTGQDDNSESLADSQPFNPALFQLPFNLPTLALTPFADPPPIVSFFELFKCSPGSVIESTLFQGSQPYPLLCNGLQFVHGPYTLNATIDGKPETIEIGDWTTNFAHLNGNIMDYSVGAITGGSCQGDSLFNFCLYSVDQFGCTGKGVNKWTYSFCVRIFSGPKCKSICNDVVGNFTMSPRLTNSGSIN